jgi:hypothetical protein
VLLAIADARVFNSLNCCVGSPLGDIFLYVMQAAIMPGAKHVCCGNDVRATAGRIKRQREEMYKASEEHNTAQDTQGNARVDFTSSQGTSFDKRSSAQLYLGKCD